MTGTTTVPESEQLSVHVIDALADATGTDPLDLQPPLYDVIDPAALDTLFTSEDATVHFEYRGHAVTVQGDGTIVVDGTHYGNEQ